jgi:hypothetical protein
MNLCRCMVVGRLDDAYPLECDPDVGLMSEARYIGTVIVAG